MDYTDMLDEDFCGMAATEGAYTFAINAAGLLFVALTVKPKGGEASESTLSPLGHHQILRQGPTLPVPVVLRPDRAHGLWSM